MFLWEEDTAEEVAVVGGATMAGEGIIVGAGGTHIMVIPITATHTTMIYIIAIHRKPHKLLWLTRGERNPGPALTGQQSPSQ